MNIVVSSAVKNQQSNHSHQQSGFLGLVEVLGSGAELSADTLALVMETAVRGVSYAEFRSRMGAAQCAGALGKRLGPQVWLRFKDTLYGMIEANFERGGEDASGSLENKQTDLKHDEPGKSGLTGNSRRR